MDMCGVTGSVSGWCGPGPAAASPESEEELARETTHCVVLGPPLPVGGRLDVCVPQGPPSVLP